MGGPGFIRRWNCWESETGVLLCYSGCTWKPLTANPSGRIVCAIVDHAMIREAAVTMNRGARFSELLHNELHNRIRRRRIAKIAGKFNTVRWPRG